MTTSAPSIGSFAHATDGAPASTSEDPKKKRHLTRAGADLFERYGIRRVSVEEVCREASCSKATFYKYFPNKSELVKHILRVMSEGAHRRVERYRQMDVPFREKAQLIVRDRIEATRRASDRFIEDLMAPDSELGPFVEELIEANHRRFVAFLEDAQRRGDVRSDLAPELMVALLTNLNQMVVDEELRDLAGGYAELTQRLVEFFFRGIAAR